MTFITTIDEIVALFPPGSVEISDGELHSPCPFCTKGGTRVVYRGVAFWGEDRLIWFADRAGVSCRRCNTYSSMQNLVSFLAPGSEVSPTLAPSEIVKEITEPVIADDNYVRKLHANVVRDYWRAFGWTDSTIDRFRVGYGRLYEFGSVQALRHVIPFNPQRVDRRYDGWAFEGRLPKGDSSGEAPNIKTKGMKGGGWFWFIHDNPAHNLVAITEGLKDAITAWQLGYENVFAVFGSNAWANTFGSFLADLGFETAHLFGDNDDAGRDFNEKIGADLHAAGIRPYQLYWSSDYPEKFDLTDLLKIAGQETTERYLEENLKLVGQTRGMIRDYRTVDPSYVPPTTTAAQPLEQIREDLPTVLAEFKGNYKLRKKAARRGVVKVLAAPPGSGKSYSLVQFAQDEAKKVLAEFEGQLTEATAALEASREMVRNATDLDELTQAQGFVERIERGIANASKAKILFAAPFVNGWEDIINQPGFDSSLWYNFQARSSDTCENFEIADKLGEKGYAVSKFCESQCPFAQHCREVGYLKQERERKDRPITFVRHANLVSESLLVGYKVIIIDENFLDVFSQFIEIEDLRDFSPSRLSWLDYEDDNFFGIEKINRFTEAARKTLAANHGKGELGLLSGLTYLRELEKNLGEPLTPFVRSLDPRAIRGYQPIAPPAFDNIDSLPRRILDPLYRAVLDELDDFDRGQPYNSRIHQIDGKLYVSSLFPLLIPASKPIIVADGTPFPDLYGYMFNRTIEIYSPEIYNREAVVEQLTGTDFSRSSIRTQVGTFSYHNLDVLSDSFVADEVPDILGDNVSLDGIPVTEDLYGSQLLQQIFDVLLQLAADPDHNKILFVTYKNLRVAMERRLKDLASGGRNKEEYRAALNKISFGHYGSLRGTNRYKDYDTVVLAGCPRQPYRYLHMKIQAWARMAGKTEYISFNVVPKPAPYHGLELYQGYTYYTFEDEFADRFVRMYEEGEIRQCLDRIRIYSGGKKHALLLMGRPAAKWVTSVLSSRQYARRAYLERNKEVFEFIQSIETAFDKLPSADALAAKFGTSKTLSNRHLKFYKENKKHFTAIS